MNSLVEWSDLSCFKAFCLDRLAVGLSPDVIASDVSAFVGRDIPVSQILDSCSEGEVLDRRKEILAKVKSDAPIITAELMSTLSRIKEFIRVAEENFDAEKELKLKDFETYRRALELKLKAIDVAAKQLKELNDSTKTAPTLIVNFDFSKLQQLADEGVVEIKDVVTAKELLGDESVEENA